MFSLDGRKVRILQAVVKDYVDTSKPVGSERLIEVYHLDCKPATVRYEMAEMAEMGYLAQPHTSAGRIPTDQGYRYFVNELMEPPASLSAAEARRVQADLNATEREIDDILQQTCRVLSGLTSYASLATDPDTDSARLRRIYLSQASPRQVLLVALLSTGNVEHRLVETVGAPDDRALIPLSNLLNSHIAGMPLEDLERILNSIAIPAELAAYTAVKATVDASLLQIVASLSQRKVYLQGANHLMKQPEFQDVMRLEGLLTALETKSILFKVLRRSLAALEVTIHIGTENPYEPMQACTLITRPYSIGNKYVGCLGVIGPTRMHYRRAISAVNYMSSSLSGMLTNMCVD